MYQKTEPLFLICQTPLHAGSGSDLGIVDLPIQRERPTGYPKIEGSSLKGAIREHFSQKTKANGKIKSAFGSESNDTDPQAGALGFTDARLLLFPVKSMKGVFAFITCKAVLERLQRDMQLADPDFKVEGLDGIDKTKTYVANGNSLEVSGNVILEEYTFKMDGKISLKVDGNDFCQWLADHLFESGSWWHEKAKTDIVILPDNDFADFVQLSTEVITRTKISSETGTVDKENGALFTEEYLPTDSVLYCMVMAAPEFKKEEDRKQFKSEVETMNFFTETMKDHHTFQLGGNSTLGKGIIQAKTLKSE